MSLKAILEETAAQGAKRVPPEMRQIMHEAAAELDAKGVGKSALRVGDKLPDATLTSATGDTVKISELLANGPLVINFYRGGWCPYCNLELKAYQDMLADIQAAGGQLVAVTPEKPDNSLSTAEKNEIAFPVLTDTNLRFAEALGIAFKMPEALIAVYSKLGLNLTETNATDDWLLPIPATFVVAADGTILLADVDSDYSRRLEPAKALAALKST